MMERSHFKVGDRIRCIPAYGGIYFGKIGTVVQAASAYGPSRITLDDKPAQWLWFGENELELLSVLDLLAEIE
jgi:hypothetical protein